MAHTAIRRRLLKYKHLSTIDVLIVASSRPECLKRTMASFLAKVEYSGHFRIVAHEDFVFRKKSEQSLYFMRRKTGFIFDKILFSDPSVGHGQALVKLLETAESEFLFHLEDDWEFETEIPLDDVIKIMKGNPGINQVFFNKYKTHHAMGGFENGKRTFDDGHVLCLYNAWCHLPGVWRTDWIKERHQWYGERYERPEGYFTNKLGSVAQRKDPGFCEKRIGSYIWGPQPEWQWRYVDHIGETLVMEEWRRDENGMPGGRVHPHYHSINRAPWLTLSPRPSRNGYE